MPDLQSIMYVEDDPDIQVVARMARSRSDTQSNGAAAKPTRRPAATFLEKPETYTVRSGASVASGGGVSAASLWRQARVISSAWVMAAL